MKEMSTLNGYEIVDKVAREMAAQGGGGAPVAVPTKVSELENDAGYVNHDEMNTAIENCVFFPPNLSNHTTKIYEAAGVSKKEYPYLLAAYSMYAYNDPGSIELYFGKQARTSFYGETCISFYGYIEMIAYSYGPIDDMTNLMGVSDYIVSAINSGNMTIKNGNTTKDVDLITGRKGVYVNFDMSNYTTASYYMFDDRIVNLGTAGQVLVTNGDGSIVFTDINNSGGGASVTVPTKVSELENDAGYITADDLSENVKINEIESRLTALESIDIAEGGAY